MDSVIKETPKQDNNSVIKVEVSPNVKYLVTYNREDRSIVGWNIGDKVEGKLKQDSIIKSDKIDYKMNINQICVSNDKKLAYIYNFSDLNYSTFIGKQ